MKSSLRNSLFGHCSSSGASDSVGCPELPLVTGLQLNHYALLIYSVFCITAVTIVIVILLVVRGLGHVLVGMGLGQRPEGLRAGRGQRPQQRRVLRHLVLLLAAVCVRVRVPLGRDHLLLAHGTRLLGFCQPRVHALAVIRC